MAVLSFGWTGSTKHWQRHESLSLVLAGLSTPLVLSVHTIVSFDFATSIVPGWHTTIFPPLLCCGCGVLWFCHGANALAVVTRKVLHLEDYITLEHIEVMNKVIVLTGSIVGVAYITELFISWYGQNLYEAAAFKNRWDLSTPYAWSYYIMMGCNVLSPQFFWFKKLRRNLLFTFFMSILVKRGYVV